MAGEFLPTEAIARVWLCPQGRATVCEAWLARAHEYMEHARWWLGESHHSEMDRYLLGKAGHDLRGLMSRLGHQARYMYG